MPSHKLIETLQCFSAPQRKRLLHFVESTYHNEKYNRPKLIQLLQHLLSRNLQVEHSHQEKKGLQALFFPDKQYQENSKNAIDSLASDLFSLTRQFIQVEQARQGNNKPKELLAMIRFYRENNLENRFWKAVKQLRRILDKVTNRGEEYYQQLLQLEEEVVTFQSIFNTYTGDSNLIRAHIALDNYYTVAKLEKAAVLLFQQKLGQVQAEDALLLNDVLINVFPSYPEIQTPLANFYHLIIQLLEDTNNDGLLSELTCLLKKHRNDVPPHKYRNIMAFYRYFVGRQYQSESSGPDLLNRLLNLYREHLQEGYFDVDELGRILPASLKLMTNIAVKVGDFDWAEQLLQTYTPNKITGTRYPLEAHSLCQAEVLFARGNFNEAEDHIIYRNFENINYSILADILLIKIYYVTEHSLLESRVSALGQKVRRTKLTKAHKQQYLNFLKVMNQLIKYRYTKPAAEIERLRTQIQELVPLLEREWLKHITAEL